MADETAVPTYQERIAELLKSLHAAAVAGDREAGEFLSGCFWPWAAREMRAPAAAPKS